MGPNSLQAVLVLVSLAESFAKSALQFNALVTAANAQGRDISDTELAQLQKARHDAQASLDAAIAKAP